MGRASSRPSGEARLRDAAGASPACWAWLRFTAGSAAVLLVFIAVGRLLGPPNPRGDEDPVCGTIAVGMIALAFGIGQRWRTRGGRILAVERRQSFTLITGGVLMLAFITDGSALDAPTATAGGWILLAFLGYLIAYAARTNWLLRVEPATVNRGSDTDLV